MDPGLAETESAVRDGIALAAKPQWSCDDTHQCCSEIEVGGSSSGRHQSGLGKTARLATYDPAAMHLLQAGVDISVIALWLGHESPLTTHHYVEADLTMKDRALARLQAPEVKVQRYRAPDSLIDFLKTL
jgi:hypothetical protein